mmetsp:Transcript_3574/g.4082  ORF Transcript_3574/g.4082 Transcript_3574/m.4082 type:complete len:97 (-) Transcript_3574:883-1173(-)
MLKQIRTSLKMRKSGTFQPYQEDAESPTRERSHSAFPSQTFTFDFQSKTGITAETIQEDTVEEFAPKRRSRSISTIASFRKRNEDILLDSDPFDPS